MAPSTSRGSPALGMQAIGIREWSDRYLSGSYISTGPVAQLSPMTCGRSPSRVVRAAPISVPGSIRPVSSIVTWTWRGTSRPECAIARRDPFTAALAPSRSNWVSMMSRSAPPSIRPAASTS